WGCGACPLTPTGCGRRPARLSTSGGGPATGGFCGRLRHGGAVGLLGFVRYGLGELSTRYASGAILTGGLVLAPGAGMAGPGLRLTPVLDVLDSVPTAQPHGHQVGSPCRHDDRIDEAA
ncbi:hypothetical protein TR74_00105, partial [Carbonactinospora thermoautotrophica]